MSLALANLPFDPADPPMHAPPGCVNRLLWQVSRRVFADHQPGPDGFCLACRPYQFYPCVGRQLADLGLRSAYQQPDGAPWRLMVVPPVDRRDRRQWLLRSPVIRPARAPSDRPDRSDPPDRAGRGIGTPPYPDH